MAEALPARLSHEGVRGPVSAAWREGTLTRAKELESLCAWIQVQAAPKPGTEILVEAIRHHIEAAREAATVAELKPNRRFHLLRYGPLRERAMSNLDAAEVLLLDIAPAWYVLGQMPSILQHVRSHLVRTDPRREELERIARRLGLGVNDGPVAAAAVAGNVVDERTSIVE